MIGSLVATVVPLAIIGTVATENQDVILSVMIGMGFLCIFPMIGTFIGVRERITVTENKSKFIESVKAAFSNKPFLYVMGIYLLTITGLEAGSAMILYYFRYSLGITDNAEIFVGIMFIVGILAIPMWNFISRKLDKTRAFVIGAVVMIITRIILMFFNVDTPVVYLYIISVIAGIGFSAGQTLPWAMMPDPIEFDEYQTGKRREGVFYSFTILCKSIAVSIALPLSLVILDASGYVANATVQTPTADFTIRSLTNLFPAILFGGAIACALLYPLTRSKFEEIQRELEIRRESDQSLIKVVD
jgi:glycoside/pentoside/hexuronide:cation symporter, GPH family